MKPKKQLLLAGALILAIALIAWLASGGDGRGSGGDNFWSTGHSAGNHADGNSRGYVGVPGVGPVGYGD